MAAMDCEVCGMGELVSGPNSTLYCENCGTQSTNYMEEAMDGDQFLVYSGNMTRRAGKAEMQQSQTAPGATPKSGAEDRATASAFEVPLPGSQFSQGSAPAGPVSEDTLAGMIRSSYVGGLQKILQLQCETLVKQFGVTPLICGIAGPIWLRYVASTRVFEKVWAEEAILVAEYRERTRKGNRRRVFQAPAQNISKDGAGTQKRQRQRQPKVRTRKGGDEDPRTSFGQKCSFVWLSALKERIPLSFTLALCYLSCYVVREPVLPTDITKWASDGQLPYLSAIVDITNPAGQRMLYTEGRKPFFPMDPDLMFRPDFLVGSRMLEIQAGFIADRVGIQRPPVNFHSVCSRFLTELRLPRKQLLSYASRLYDWHVPSGFWLSGRELAVPIRVYVMAMLIVAMKVLYKLDGSALQQREATPSTQCLSPISEIQLLGKRRRSSMGSSRRDRQGNISGVEEDQISGEVNGESLRHIDAVSEGDKRTELHGTEELIAILESSGKVDKADYDESLARYLRYCRNVVFHGYDHDDAFQHEADIFLERYEKETRNLTRELSNQADADLPSTRKFSRTQQTSGLISDMKKAGFSYLPPLGKCVDPEKYVRYSFYVPRDRDTVSIHSDYFKVLQACSSLINVDARTLHYGVQIIEKGLLQVENKVQNFVAGIDDKLGGFAEGLTKKKYVRKRNRIIGAASANMAEEGTREHLTDLSYI